MCDDERTRLNPKNGMSAEEAKKYLEHYVEILMDSNEDKKIKDTLFEIHVKAINALEKQIPKKPKITLHNGYCGNCGYAWGKDRLVTEEYCGYKYFQFCPICGQAIDWSDDND